MKRLTFMLLYIVCPMTFCSDGNLFDNLCFHEKKTQLLDVPVTFYSIGKNPFDMNVFHQYGKHIRSHTAMAFRYNNVIYYLPIDNKVTCNFLDTCKKGDELYIDIFVTDSIYSKATQREGVNIFYSYITAIR